MNHIEKWMGYFVNSKGEIDCMTWDHNPGHLNHVVKVLVPVPEEVENHFKAHHKCLLLDKKGEPVDACPGPLFKPKTNDRNLCSETCAWGGRGTECLQPDGHDCVAPKGMVYAHRDLEYSK